MDLLLEEAGDRLNVVTKVAKTFKTEYVCPDCLAIVEPVWDENLDIILFCESCGFMED